MVRRFKIEDSAHMNDEELAIEIIDRLKRTSIYDPENLYRGIVGNERKLQEVLLKGTDRTTKDHKYSVSEEHLIIDPESRRFKLPQGVIPVFLNPESRIVESVGYARDLSATDDIGIFMVYRGKGLTERMEHELHGQYTFNGNPLESLRSVFIIKD